MPKCRFELSFQERDQRFIQKWIIRPLQQCKCTVFLYYVLWYRFELSDSFQPPRYTLYSLSMNIRSTFINNVKVNQCKSDVFHLEQFWERIYGRKSPQRRLNNAKRDKTHSHIPLIYRRYNYDLEMREFARYSIQSEFSKRNFQPLFQLSME